MVPQITSNSTVCSAVCLQKNTTTPQHQSFMKIIHNWSIYFPHKQSMIRESFPYHDVTIPNKRIGWVKQQSDCRQYIPGIIHMVQFALYFLYVCVLFVVKQWSVFHISHNTSQRLIAAVTVKQSWKIWVNVSHELQYDLMILAGQNETKPCVDSMDKLCMKNQTNIAWWCSKSKIMLEGKHVIFIDVWKCSPKWDICVLSNKLCIIGQDPYISFRGIHANIYEKQAHSVECKVDIYL